MATTINNAFHDTSYEGEMRNTDNSNSGPDGRTNTGDWSRNDNRGNTGVIAGNGSKNAVNNGPSITATMFENGSRITFNGGSYHNVAGCNSELVLVARQCTNSRLDRYSLRGWASHPREDNVNLQGMLLSPVTDHERKGIYLCVAWL